MCEKMKMPVRENSISSATSRSELSSDDCPMKDNSSERITTDTNQLSNPTGKKCRGYQMYAVYLQSPSVYHYQLCICPAFFLDFFLCWIAEVLKINCLSFVYEFAINQSGRKITGGCLCITRTRSINDVVLVCVILKVFS